MGKNKGRKQIILVFTHRHTLPPTSPSTSTPWRELPSPKALTEKFMAKVNDADDDRCETPFAAEATDIARGRKGGKPSVKRRRRARPPVARFSLPMHACFRLRDGPCAAVWNKPDQTGCGFKAAKCKWSYLNALGTEIPESHTLLVIRKGSPPV